MNEKTDTLAVDRRDFELLRSQARSLVMATVNSDSVPRTSYAPFVLESGEFHVYLSRLSEHTLDLLENPVVSVMLIEDEAAASQVFARKRIAYACDSQAMESDDPTYEAVMQLLTNRFGKVMILLQSLPDFVLFRFRPASGRFVTGFGKAYDLRGDTLDELVPLGPDDVGASRRGRKQ